MLQKLKDIGVDDDTIVVFTTDNGTESFTWPDGGTTPFAQCKGTIMEGGFRVPAILRWPAGASGHGAEWPLLRPGLVPTFLAAAVTPPSLTTCSRA
jgi:arylsulfatase